MADLPFALCVGPPGRSPYKTAGLRQRRSLGYRIRILTLASAGSIAALCESRQELARAREKAQNRPFQDVSPVPRERTIQRATNFVRIARGRLAGFGHDNLRIAFRNHTCGGTRFP